MWVGKITESKTLVLFDGAMGTELMARGWVAGGSCPESWNIEHPDQVRAIHEAYVAAGAEAIQTNTFGILKSRLARYGQEQEQAELIKSAVDLARSAQSRWVVGSLGPSGETLSLAAIPVAEADRIGADYESAAEKLASAGVDAIHLETQFHPGELSLALAAVRRAAPDLPLFASVTLMPGVTGLETPHGVPAERMVRALAENPPDVAGINCSIDAERSLAAVRLLRRHLPLPLMVQPQAKMAQKCVVPKPLESPEQFSGHMIRLVQAGATFLGGCCGVGPAEILALRRLLDVPQLNIAMEEPWQEMEMEAIP